MIEFGWILNYQSVDKVNYWENVSCLLIKNQREYLWCHWQWFSCLWVKIKLKFKLNTIFRTKTAPRTSRTWKRMIYSNEAQTTISFWWFFQETKENIKFQSISIQAICGQTHLVIVSENWQSNVNQNWTIILGFLWWQHVIWLSKVVKKKSRWQSLLHFNQTISSCNIPFCKAILAGVIVYVLKAEILPRNRHRKEEEHI